MKGSIGAFLFLVLAVVAGIWVFLKWGYMLPATTATGKMLAGGGNNAALPGVSLVDKFRQAGAGLQSVGSLTGTVLTSRKAV